LQESGESLEVRADFIFKSKGRADSVLPFFIAGLVSLQVPFSPANAFQTALAIVGITYKKAGSTGR
jgi:hypothetical protein